MKKHQAPVDYQKIAEDIKQTHLDDLKFVPIKELRLEAFHILVSTEDPQYFIKRPLISNILNDAVESLSICNSEEDLMAMAEYLDRCDTYIREYDDRFCKSYSEYGGRHGHDVLIEVYRALYLWKRVLKVEGE